MGANDLINNQVWSTWRAYGLLDCLLTLQLTGFPTIVHTWKSYTWFNI